MKGYQIFRIFLKQKDGGALALLYHKILTNELLEPIEQTLLDAKKWNDYIRYFLEYENIHFMVAMQQSRIYFDIKNIEIKILE